MLTNNVNLKQEGAFVETDSATNASSPTDNTGSVRMGNRIKELRVNNSLSQAKLAGALNCTGPYISAIENGKRGASEEMLVKIEKFFGLEEAALVTMRSPQTIHEQPQEEEQALTDQQPDYIQTLVETLQSFDEAYGRSLVTDFIKQLQDNHINHLTPYEFNEIEHYVSNVKKEWLEGTNGNQTLTNDVPVMEGNLIQGERKNYFSLQLKAYSLELHLLQEEKDLAENFEKWLGPGSVRYTTSRKMPNIAREKKMVGIVWFHPQTTIVDMYRYLKDSDIDLQDPDVCEPRLQWYIQQNNPIVNLETVQ